MGSDDRRVLPTIGSEAEVLVAYLDWHRATVALKCSGLSAEQLSTRSIPPSSMSLHGLIRHLTAAERGGCASSSRRRTSQHNGHPDLLRECVEGATGL